MMILNRTQSEKGFYRIAIWTRSRKYRFYSNSAEIEQKLDFEQTELSQLYRELKRHHVKCC